MLFGITQDGDCGLDFSWINQISNLFGISIFTRNITHDLFSALIKYSNKIVLHLVISGFGGTIIEPNVPNYKSIFIQLLTLISLKFPKNQIIIELDPLFPGYNSDYLSSILQFCQKNRLFQIRFNFLNLTTSNINRFKRLDINYPNFDIKYFKRQKNEYFELFKSYPKLKFETCQSYSTKYKKYENINYNRNISNLDYLLLNQASLEDSNLPLKIKKIKINQNAQKCFHDCIHCYLKDY